MANLSSLLLLIIQSTLAFTCLTNVQSITGTKMNSSFVEKELATCDNSKLASNCTKSASEKSRNLTTASPQLVRSSTPSQVYNAATTAQPRVNTQSIRPTVQPNPNSLTTPSPGLITRTTGAIYRALSNVFSFSDEREAKPQSTTPLPTQRASPGPVKLADLHEKPSSKPKSKSNKSTTKAEVDLEYHDEHEDFIRLTKTTTTTRHPATTTTTTAAAATTTTTTTKPTTTTTTFTTTFAMPAHKSSHTSKSHKTKTTATTRPPETTSARSSDRLPASIPSANNRASIEADETAKASRIYGMLTHALRSVYNLNPFLNRTTRVAPEHELGDFKIESGKLMLGNDVIQPATSEDVHLLCKLLHKHLENITTTTTTATATTAFSTTVSNAAKVFPATGATTEMPTTTSGPLSSTTDTPERNHSESSTAKPGKEKTKLYVSEPNQLGGAHEDHLLESVFAYSEKQFKNNETLDRVARRLLLDLLELGAKRTENGTELAAGNEYENDEEDGANSPANDDELSVGSAASGDSNHHRRHRNHRNHHNKQQQQSTKLKMKVYEKYSHATSDKLHLVYWILKRNRNQTDSNLEFQVLAYREAGQLIDKLEHAQVERVLNAANLRSVILMAPYKSRKHKHDHELEPHIIDDTLSDKQTKDRVEKEQSSSDEESSTKNNTFQLLVNKLTSSNFIDNLHLYGIIFVILLMCIVLCFACPLFCFKPASSSKSKSLSGDDSSRGSVSLQQATRVNKRKTNNRRGRNKMSGGGLPHAREVASIEGNLKDLNSRRADQVASQEAQKASDAIWRKLSNTTTTFVKDQSELIMVRKEGTTRAPVLEDGAVGSSADTIQADEIPISKKSQFEWYSFEEDHSSDKTDKWKKPHNYVVSDKKKITKSIQTTTFHEQPAQTTFDESYSESLNDYKDKIDTRKRSSDTLTKSELVMLKEKMIPIAQQHQQHYRQVASQTSTPSEPIYVNQALVTKAVQTGQSIDSASQQQQHQLEQVANDRTCDGESTPRSGGDNNKRTPPLDRVVSNFIDSSESRSDSANKGSTVIDKFGDEREREQQERIPKMRHLDLPPRTRSKVDAIKAELSRLEQRDNQQASKSVASVSGYNSNKDLETSSYRRF